MFHGAFGAAARVAFSPRYLSYPPVEMCQLGGVEGRKGWGVVKQANTTASALRYGYHSSVASGVGHADEPLEAPPPAGGHSEKARRL